MRKLDNRMIDISFHNKDPNAHTNLFSVDPVANTAPLRENNGEFRIKDRATGIIYRVFVENGALKLEPV